MKKAKVMLTGIALLAVVGGALAFKSYYSDQFCVKLASSGTGTCTAAFTGKVTTGTGTSYYTAAFDTNCGNKTCNGTSVILTTTEP